MCILVGKGGEWCGRVVWCEVCVVLWWSVEGKVWGSAVGCKVWWDVVESGVAEWHGVCCGLWCGRMWWFVVRCGEVWRVRCGRARCAAVIWCKVWILGW